MKYILNKSDLAQVDELSDDVEINGLNQLCLLVQADSLAEAQAAAGASKVEELWTVVNNWVDQSSGFDDKFQKKCISWKSDSSSSPTRLQRIADMETWSDTIWQEYGRLRVLYLANNFSEEFTPSVIAPRPWSFWDVAGV
jgi:hypothetical protein